MRTLPNLPKVFLTIPLTLSLLVACQAPDNPGESAEAGSSPVAFRSTVDGVPRVLTLAPTADVRLAYDTASGTLYKLWEGELALAGAVFDARHGPQPESIGTVYLQNEGSHWQDGVRYRGHRFAGGEVSLLRELNTGEWRAEIEEWPQVQKEGDSLNLQRRFEVTGLPEGEVITLSGLTLPAGYRVEGAGRVEGDRLMLSNGSTLLHTRHAPLPEARVAESEEQPAGLVAINNSDCAACHNPEVQTVGPAYVDIAQRYAGDVDAASLLAERIIAGGSGNWGPVAMTPHPDLDTDTAEEMAGYILSLNPGEEATDESDTALLIHLPAAEAKLQPATPEITEPQSGALMYLHYFSGDQPNLEKLRTEAPAMAAHSRQIHLPTIEDLAPLSERFALQVKARLTLDKPLKTQLRLVSDDGAYLYLNGERLIDNWGFHGPVPVDAEVSLPAGDHPLEIIYFQGTMGATLSLQWQNPATGEFELLPESMLQVTAEEVRQVRPVITDPDIVKSIPGDTREVAGMHPAFDRYQARPDHFKPMVGGLDFLPDGRLVVSTWDASGSVFVVENITATDPAAINVKRVATGLAEPLGVKVVDGDIYVMQKQELTRLVDDNGDDIIDRYLVVANDWPVTDNFHEFAFGLEYEDGYFYATFATAILPGGASADPQAPGRGSAVKIHKDTGEVEFIASGFRTPNGIGRGVDGGLFVADNQGDWLPSSKIVELTEGAWYGSRSVDFAGTEGLTETQPVVWLPQDEIGNSPGEPAPLNVGPYKNQMIHGEITHGGIKRVFAERVNGRLQGAVFRFMQGLEAGINRLEWAPDGSLIAGGVGNPGNWSHGDKHWYGLERLVYNGDTAFEMLSVSARSDGFEVTFTEAIKPGQNITAEDFEIRQWRYQPTAEYGGPKIDDQVLAAEEFSLSEDGTRASFKLAGLKDQHLVYFRIARPFVSVNDRGLWTTEAWYTLNAIPEDKPVAINADYQVAHNQLSAEEREAGWQLLFDGESLAGLRNYNSDTLGERWVIDDGALHLTGLKPGESGWHTPEGGGDVVITSEPVTNYELYLEWKLEENGNSGIIYNVKEDPALEYPFLSGTEYQLLDNVGHPDGKIETHRAGDLYDLIKSRFVAVNPPGEWNRTRLVVNNGRIEHWLNGYKVVETQMGGPEWQALLADSKFSDWEHFAQQPGGHIVLQDHADKVWFRNIKLRSLDHP